MASTEQITQLTEAKNARHKLMTGTAVVRVNKDGLSVEYTRASLRELTAYIETLELAVNSVGNRRAPAGVRF